MPGSPGIASGPYSGYLWGASMSAGRRVALEIKEAIHSKQLKKIVT
jgi:5-formaminoimidazole-4-carboxamide-1-beta-D-ribofuranosyl 5'-monophosphate synthetase